MGFNNKVCRTCLSTNTKVMLLLSPTSEKMIEVVDVIKMCSSVEVNEGDGLPSHICFQCFSDTTTVSLFIQKCKMSDTSLKSIYERYDAYSVEGSMGYNRKVCRTCLCTNTKVVSLFSPKTQKTKDVIDIIRRCASVEINEGDGLPPYMCLQCLTDATMVLLFSQKCKLSDSSLKSIFKHNDVVPQKPRLPNQENSLHIVENVIPEAQISVKLPANNLVNSGELVVFQNKNVSKSNTKEAASTQNQEWIILQVEDIDKALAIIGEDKTIEVADDQDTAVEIDVKPELIKEVYSLNEIDSKTNELSAENELPNNEVGDNVLTASDEAKNYVPCSCVNGIPCKSDKTDSECCDYFSDHNVFRCRVCRKVCHTESILKLHLEQMHCGVPVDREKHYCSFCENNFQTFRELQLHKKQHKVPHLCYICGQVFKARTSYLCHINKHSGIRPFKCTEPGCNKSYTYRNVLRLHVMCFHRRKIRFTCEFCDKKFIHEQHFRVHILRHTGLKPHRCEVCGKSFLEKNILKQHIVMHCKQSEPVSCPYCNATFRNRRFKTNHIIAFHPEQMVFSCSICGGFYGTEEDLSIHEMSHTKGGKVYPCRKCEIRFETIQERRNHFRTQHQSRFLCNFCGKVLTTKISLENHVASVHEGIVHICAVENCGKLYKSLLMLNSHMTYAHGEAGSECLECGKKFMTASHLKRHLVTHSGNYRFRCKFCNKGFSDISNCRVHLRTHTGEKPFVCAICSKGFTEKRSLHKHRLTKHENKICLSIE